MDGMNTGARIALMRKEKGLTAEKLAELLSVTPQAVSKWETGKSLPETATLPALAGALNCSIDSLLMPRELQVLKAVYTDGVCEIDLTPFVDNMVSGSRLSLPVGEPFLNARIESGRVKVLAVKYQTPRGTRVAFAAEGGRLSIDTDSGEALDMPFEIIGAFYGNEDDFRDCMGKIRHYDFFKWQSFHANHELFPSSTASDKTEYLTVVYKNQSGIRVVSCAEGERLRYDGERCVMFADSPGERLIAAGVPALRWGQGMDCTWAGALRASLAYMGEDFSYEYVMGVSGACYRFAFTPVWDYSSVDALVAFDYADIALKALGRAYSWADRIDKSQRAAERQRIVEDLRSGRPPIAINLRVAPEWGVIAGYLEGGKRLLCRTYFDDALLKQNEGNPDFPAETGGYTEAEFWPFAILHLGEKRDRPGEDEIAINSLKAFIDSMHAPANRGYYQGFEAYRKWIERLSDADFKKAVETRGADGQPDIERVLCVNDYQLINLIDARRCAAAYLEGAAARFEGPRRGAFERLAAIFSRITAELQAFYRAIADAKGPGVSFKPMNGSFIWDDSLTARQIALIEWMMAQEQEAVELAKELVQA